jgi:hypothetical protein
MAHGTMGFGTYAKNSSSFHQRILQGKRPIGGYDRLEISSLKVLLNYVNCVSTGGCNLQDQRRRSWMRVIQAA